MLKMLSFKLLLLLAVALGFFEGDAKFGEGSGARRRRCLNGNPPKRLKRRDRRMMSQLELSGGEVLCGGFYPRVSCCLQSDSPGLGLLENKVGAAQPGGRTDGRTDANLAYWLGGFPVAAAMLVVARGAKLVWALVITFLKRRGDLVVCFLWAVLIVLPPPESAVEMLGKLACLRKETLLWYPRPGLGKYFKRIAINSVFLDQIGH